MARVLLINPPAASVWHIPAGVGYLAGYLAAHGYEVVQSYAHVKGVEHLFRGDPDMERALRIVRDPSATIQERYWARMAAERASRSVQSSDTFRVERNNVVFKSPHDDGTIAGAVQAVRERERHIWYQYFIERELKVVARSAPAICGISIGDQRQFLPGLILGSLIKDTFPTVKVVLGGNVWPRLSHAFRLPRFGELMAMTCHAIAVSEGFDTLRLLADGVPYKVIPQLAWLDGGCIRVNMLYSEPADFNTLPSPVYDDLDGVTQWAPDTVLPLYAASNCTKQCGYCDISGGSASFLSQPRIRHADNVVRDMVATGAHRFDFTEELLSIDRQIEIGRVLARVGYQATWQCYLNVDDTLLSLEKCQELSQAGCRAVQLGLESLSRTTLRRERKGMNNPENYGMILANLRDAGIQTHAFVILGIPGDDAQSQLEWPAFLREHGRNILTIKASRYQLTRLSPEGQALALGERAKFPHLSSIAIENDDQPLRLNRRFRYLSEMSMKKVDALVDVLEEACRRHWAYGVTSTLPWWANRGRYSWRLLEEMTGQLPDEDRVDLSGALPRVRTMLQKDITIFEQLEGGF